MDFVVREASGPVSVFVANTHGELVAAATMDGAAPDTRLNAQRKAYTAARSDARSTRELAEKVREDAVERESFDPFFTFFLGGLAAFEGETRVGAVGVSGLPGEVDEALAQKALEAVGLSVESSIRERASPCRRDVRRRPRNGRAGRGGVTNCSSASGQRRRAISRSSTAASQSSRRALTLPKRTRFSRIVSTPSTGPSSSTVCCRGSIPSRHATPLRRSSPRRLGHQLRVAGGFDHEVELSERRQLGVMRRDVVRARLFDERRSQARATPSSPPRPRGVGGTSSAGRWRLRR